jgi:hypothetical protein
MSAAHTFVMPFFLQDILEFSPPSEACSSSRLVSRSW